VDPGFRRDDGKRLVRDCLRLSQKAPVRHAARSLPEPLMRERQGNIPLADAHRRFRECVQVTTSRCA